MGLGTLAAQIGRSKGHLSKVERNVDNRAASPALIRDYQRALGVNVSATAPDEVSATRLSGLPDEVSPARVATRRDPADVDVVLNLGDARPTAERMTRQPSAADLSKEAEDVDAEENVKRRTFVTGAAITGLALLAPQASWLADNRRIGLPDVRRLTNRTARQRRLDDYLGGADTYQTYIVELEATKKLHREGSYADSVGEALLSLIAEQAQQAGWAAFDAGDHQESRRLFLESLSAAKESHSNSLAANAHAYLAYQQASTGNSGVDAAIRSTETINADAPPAVQALLLERLAWAHAVARQPNETERALGQAHEALDSPGGEPAPDWAKWVDHDEIQIMTGRCWTELNRPLRAVPVLTQVLKNFDDRHARDKSLYLTWLAAAYLDANEPERAASVTRRATTLAMDVSSVRPRQRITPLFKRFQPYRQLPEVADLLKLLHSWLLVT